MTEAFEANADSTNQARSANTDLNDRLSDNRSDRGIITYFLLSPSSKITNPEKKPNINK